MWRRTMGYIFKYNLKGNLNPIIHVKSGLLDRINLGPNSGDTCLLFTISF